MRFAFQIAYIGHKFHGYARQPDLNTIEGNLLDFLLQNNLIISIEDAKIRIASRTDKGVSSVGNVVVFQCTEKPELIIKEINAKLDDIFILGYKTVDNAFNPRYAKMRSYRYFLKNKQYDVDKIIAAAACFTGSHNFTNFARIESHRNPVRTIENILIESSSHFVIIDIYAHTFLWHQIRRIISALQKTGSDELDEEDIIAALYYPNQRIDYGLASANPLVLRSVDYDFSFHQIPNINETLHHIKEEIIHQII